MPQLIGSTRPSIGVGGDGGVDGVAAALEDVEARLRRQRLAGGDHAVLGDDHAAALPGILARPIVAGGEGGIDGSLSRKSSWRHRRRDARSQECMIWASR